MEGRESVFIEYLLKIPGEVNQNSKSVKKEGLLGGLLILICLFLFRDILFGGHLLAGADFISFYLGLKQFLFNEVHQHHTIPFWNPFVFGGIPFLAHFESTIFYPLDILFWFISPEKAYGPTMCLHFMVAALSMYLLARSLGMGRAASFMAATIYILNGHILPVLNNGLMYRIQAVTWIPLIIFFLQRATTSRAPYLNGAIAGLLWGIQILSGSPQDAFYTFLAGCFFLLCKAKIRAGERKENLQLLFIACLVFFAGAGLASVQLVPAFEFISRSVRTLLGSYEIRTMGSYPLEGIITMVMPHFFGNFAQRTFWVFGTPWTIPVYNLYVGVLPLILLFYGLRPSSRSNRLLVFCVGLAVLALVSALGANTPIYRLTSYLPGFDRIRAPEKTIALWAFAFGILAGMAMDTFLKREKSFLLRRSRVLFLVFCSLLALGVVLSLDRALVLKVFSPFILDAAIPEKMSAAASIILREYQRLIIVFGICLLLILLYTRGLLNRRSAAVLFCGLLLADLMYVNRGAVPYNDVLYEWAEQTKSDLDRTIGQDKEIYRVGSYKFGMGASIDMYLGYQTVGGYNALFLRRYYEYINQYRFYKKPVPKGWIIFFYGDYENTVLMDLLNVKYVISFATESYGLRDSYLPRAFIVPRAKTLPKEEILGTLIAPDFDPRETVLLEGNAPLISPSGERPEAGQPPGEATITSYRPDEILIRTHSREPAYLFLSEAFYPGWKAYVDGRPVRIYRGNYLFRVIELPRGSHEVRYVFDPVSVKVGAGMTLLTILVLAIALIRRVLLGSKAHQK